MTSIVDSVLDGCMAVFTISAALIIGCVALGIFGSFIFAAREAWWDWQERRKEHDK